MPGLSCLFWGSRGEKRRSQGPGGKKKLSKGVPFDSGSDNHKITQVAGFCKCFFHKLHKEIEKFFCGKGPEGNYQKVRFLTAGVGCLVWQAWRCPRRAVFFGHPPGKPHKSLRIVAQGPPYVPVSEPTACVGVSKSAVPNHFLRKQGGEEMQLARGLRGGEDPRLGIRNLLPGTFERKEK